MSEEKSFYAIKEEKMSDIDFVESTFITRDGIRVRQDTGEPAPEELSEDDQAFRAWKRKQAKIKRQKLKEHGGK